MKRGSFALTATGLSIVIGAAIGWPAYSQQRHLAELHDAGAQLQLLADNFDGFQCDDVQVAAVEEPVGRYFGGGARLRMPDHCSDELLKRANSSSRFTANRDGDCFYRDAGPAGLELCVADNGVYFGAVRVG